MTLKQYHQRLRRPLVTCIFLLALSLLTAPRVYGEEPAPSARQVATSAPGLGNPGFECAEGYGLQPGIPGQVPSGWTAVLLAGRPTLNSTRVEFTGSCDGEGFVERLEGEDSLVLLSEDIETPPEPGKPFDATVYQRVAVTPGTAYSLSSWMVSLCGGSAMPNDCPAGYFMAKMAGIDPAGGTDPLAAGVVWVEDLRNFTESRWANLRLGTTAQGSMVTVFARIRSPYRWHGAHAFMDAISLVRAPMAQLVNLPATVDGNQVKVRWTGQLSPDILAIPGGTYQLLFDVQVRRSGQVAWSDWQVGRPAGEAQFMAEACTGPGLAYEFRVRARAEQPAGSNGAWPNHRYPGDWSAAQTVSFHGSISCTLRTVLPLILK
jgi:hypothetical protein